MKGVLWGKCKKTLSIIIALVLVLQPINIEATQSKSGNFNGAFSLSGKDADKLLAVAQAQIGRTKAQMGYTEAWCADFVSDCAKLAGLSSLIPFDGYCQTLYNKVKNAGGQDVSTPQKGDLVFYYCSSCSVHWCHVGIMLDGQKSVEGNYGGKVSLVNGSYTDSNGHTLKSGTVTRRFVRPAYVEEKKISPPQIRTWLSTSPMGATVGNIRSGEMYYLCFELIDPDSGKRYNSVTNSTYTIKETIYSPDGSVASTATYKNSDNNWIGYQTRNAGVHKGVIEISGDFIGSSKITYDIPKVTTPKLGVWFSDSKMGDQITELEEGKQYYLCYKLIDGNTNKTWNNVSSNSYKVEEIIYKADGSTHSYTYTNSDNNWIGSVASTPGTYKGIIKVTGDFSGQREITITLEEPKLTKIAITKNPNKTSYYVGDKLSMDGMKVVAIYDNGTRKEVSNYQVSGNTYVADKQNVTISYTEGGITRTTVQQIEVVEKHSHSYSGKITKAATCTQEGVKTYSCSCGASYTQTIAKLNHNWDSGRITKNPTTAEKGVKTYTCYLCGETKKESMPVLEKVKKSEEDLEEESEEEFPESGDIVIYENAEYEVIVSTEEVEVEYTGLVKKKVRKVDIPDTIETEDGVICKVTSISNSAFKNNKFIEEVTIGKNVTTIGKKAFYNCKNLKEVNVGDNVTFIGANAFSKCVNLKQLVIPTNVRKIESNAFYGCKKLKKLVIKTSKLTKKNIGKKALKGIPAKTVVYVPKSKIRIYKKLLRQSGLSKKVKILQL